MKGRKDALVLISSLNMATQKEVAAELENLGLAHLTIYEYVFGKKTDEVLK